MPHVFLNSWHICYYPDLLVKEINCLTPIQDFVKLYWLTKRFHVAASLFSKRLQITSNVVRTEKVALEVEPSLSMMLWLLHFDIICDLLLYRPTATWNLFVLCDYKPKFFWGGWCHLCICPWIYRPITLSYIDHFKFTRRSFKWYSFCWQIF